MKKLFLVMLVVGLAVWVVPVANAGPDRSVVFSDCSFVREGSVSVTPDTLWFVSANSSGGRGTTHWFPPVAVPYASDNDGGLKYKKSAARTVLLYSEEPFQYKSHGGGLTFSPATWVQVDTLAGAGVPHSDTYPCWTVISWPDSVHIKEAGSDTVNCVIGYD